MAYEADPAKFWELAKHHFGYLIKECGCLVTKTFYDYAPAGEICFRSTSTVVTVEYERNVVFTWIGPAAEPKVAWLPLWRVRDFPATALT